MDSPVEPHRYRFGRSSRLHGRAAFGQVFQRRRRKHLGPITIYIKPNGLSGPRLGLSVSRRVGNAVKRNRIKRLIREAFRMSQNDWTGGFDVVVVVRPHEPLKLADYQQMLATVIRWADRYRNDF